MTASGLILPGRSPMQVAQTSSAMFLWRASDLDVVPVTMQQANFAREGLSTPTDDKDVSWTAAPHAPAWSMFPSDASLVPDRGALLMTAIDSLNWPVLFMPPFAGESLSMLVQFSPMWPRSGSADPFGVVALGHGPEIADGKVTLGVGRTASGSLQAAMRVGLSTSALQFTIPATGLLTMLVQLRPLGANHYIWAELNGVAQDNIGGSQPVNGKPWRTPDLTLNIGPSDTSSVPGDSLYTRLVVARGQRTAEELLAL